jgi:hypothetical protein
MESTGKFLERQSIITRTSVPDSQLATSMEAKRREDRNGDGLLFHDARRLHATGKEEESRFEF